MQKIFKPFLLIITLLAIFLPDAKAQTNHVNVRSLSAKQRKAMHSRDSLLRTFNGADTSVNNLLQRLEQYNTSFNQIKNNFSDGLDTADIGEKVPSTLRRLNKIKDQANTHKASTLRYLFVLRDNLDHIQGRLEGWQKDLDAINNKLVVNQKELIKFTKDSLLLKTIPSDSVLRMTFFDRRKAVILLWITTDSINRRNLFKINLLQNRVAVAYASALDETDLIDTKVGRFAERAFQGEFGYLWDIDPQYNNIRSSIAGTISLNSTQLYYFIRKETTLHFISLVFFVLVVGWITYNREKTKRESESPDLIFKQANYIYRYPILSSMLVPIAIIPYFYDHPPVIFLECFFLTSLILVMILVKKVFHPDLFTALSQLFCLTIVYSASNLLIQITNLDRFVILFLSIAAIIIAFRLNKKVNAAPDDYPKNTGFVIKIFIGLQILALVCDISGRFSLAKIISITATYNLWFLISLYFVVEIISQGILLQLQTKKDTDNIVSWIDQALLQVKFRKILNVLATLLWLFFLFQNLNVDDAATDYVTDLLDQPRTVGGASFTFGGFVIFIAVIWLSSVLSKIISYFYDISAQRSTDIDALKKKNRTSTLLIRIGVFTLGFFLAVFASNFPLDKITIIISAFGIGIGFGLQNIVNNLVSGLILAFEKPVQIGDIIEVDNRSGTITEIGIRSSKIATSDGAEVIVPNGDLISHHVINWTLSNNNRRIELIISVKYGSDLEKVKTLLLDVLNTREDIMTEPHPLVFLHNLTGSSADFRILFWADDINRWLELKDHVLSDIFISFDKAGIELASTAQDLHLKLPDGKTINIDNNGPPENLPEKSK
ncbi:mechanosensitive ion channel family protein [Mucilaginibacter sp. UR6-11]|uniref:mechanosensitive ion channel family protein n=1 Tax=Mucilaginibacter sp. UR6-11 TaxID=1435644 RepID=UPI001E5086C5|nr:mechanosensitive ion channel domain-containing protein [Mucilaginibacter sp. UR6-11]MCC8426755.1 mechanosensitive ion channel [Mucilaginibacter sp. UR6-11]